MVVFCSKRTRAVPGGRAPRRCRGDADLLHRRGGPRPGGAVSDQHAPEGACARAARLHSDSPEGRQFAVSARAASQGFPWRAPGRGAHGAGTCIAAANRTYGGGRLAPNDAARTQNDWAPAPRRRFCWPPGCWGWPRRVQAVSGARLDSGALARRGCFCSGRHGGCRPPRRRTPALRCTAGTSGAPP